MSVWQNDLKINSGYNNKGCFICFFTFYFGFVTIFYMFYFGFVTIFYVFYFGFVTNISVFYFGFVTKVTLSACVLQFLTPQKAASILFAFCGV